MVVESDPGEGAILAYGKSSPEAGRHTKSRAIFGTLTC